MLVQATYTDKAVPDTPTPTASLDDFEASVGTTQRLPSLTVVARAQRHSFSATEICIACRAHTRGIRMLRRFKRRWPAVPVRHCSAVPRMCLRKVLRRDLAPPTPLLHTVSLSD